MKMILFILALLVITNSSHATKVYNAHSLDNKVIQELGINYEKLVVIKQLDSKTVITRIVHPWFELSENGKTIKKYVYANFFSTIFFCKNLDLGQTHYGVLSDQNYPHDSMLSAYDDKVSEMNSTESEKIYTSIDCIK